MLPLAVPTVLTHDGGHLGDGLAYSWCETATGDSLFAAVPMCGTDWSKLDDCKQGHISEFDPSGLTPLGRHFLLTDDFYGRLEYLLCLEETVQVGLNHTYVSGEQNNENVLEFYIDDPEHVHFDLLGEAGGHRIVHDETNGALLYLATEVPVFHRVDRATGRIERWESEGLAERRSSWACDTPSARASSPSGRRVRSSRPRSRRSRPWPATPRRAPPRSSSTPSSTAST